MLNSVHKVYYKQNVQKKRKQTHISFRTVHKITKIRRIEPIVQKFRLLVTVIAEKIHLISIDFSQKAAVPRSTKVLIDSTFRKKMVFKEMAQFVGTRDGIQCRSHHVKLVKTHKKIGKIIKSF